KNFNIQQRIYKGEDAQKGQFPYIVSLSISLSDNNGALCGGSIIDHTWILTAAHCTHKAKSIKIFYGSTKVAQGEFSHEVNTDNIIEHEHYDDDTLENDLALIRTPHVDYSELVNKVSLADRDNDYEGAWAVASGWGETYDNSATPENLQFADLQIKSKKDCWDAIGRESDNILCVSTSEGKTIGSGDSGGPLVTHDDPKLVGSIIDHNWILTAAHCTHNAVWVQIFYATTEKWKSQISHGVSSDNIIEHELYNDFTLLNDIALIRTPRVEYSELVNKVSLADRDNDYEGSWAVASGWGEIENNSKLQFVGLQIDRKSSNTIIRSTISNGKSCGGGDSGGPLVTQDDPKLIGVTSKGQPGVSTAFTRVSAYLDWIRSHTGL
ncbi:hypothetical protein KR215_009498, partial [Drosophila sulfurigaster]